MPMKSYNPTTPSRRFMSVVSREEITKQTPEKSLVVGKKRTGGRNSEGLVSSRFRGGGAGFPATGRTGRKRTCG